MTTVNITAALPGDQSGVAIATKVDGYTIKWTPQILGETVEIWQHTSNVRSSATKVATVSDTYYDSATLPVGVTYYIWTRRVSEFGVFGNWDFGATSGQMITVTGITTANQAVGIVTPETITVTTASDTIVPSSYNTWTDTGNYGEFVAPAFPAIIAGFVIVGASASGFSGSGISNLVGRIRLYNVTESSFVEGAEQYANFSFYVSSGSFEFKNEVQTIRAKVDSGFGAGGLIPGDTYRFIFELNKQQLGGSVTFTASVIVGEFAGVAFDSASVT